MEPEEIDKLFKNKLAGLPAAPSPDAWMRLQQKMEPPKKERTMWVYYVAASVSLLLISGILYFKSLNQSDNSGLASVNTRPQNNQIQVQENSGRKEQNKYNFHATEQDNPEKQNNEQIIKPEQIAQTVIVAPDYNIKSKKPQTRLAQAKANKQQAIVYAKRPKSVSPKVDEPGTILENRNIPETIAEPITLASGNAKNNQPENALTGSIVEVIIKRDHAKETAAIDSESGLRENLVKKANLLKNIYKQARNLKNGEQVELTALGIDTEKINSETKEIKQKITKVISL